MITKDFFPDGPRQHLGGAPAAPQENLDFSKNIQNVSYDTILKNIDQMWYFGEKIIKIGSFLTKLWLFEVEKEAWRHHTDNFLYAPVEPATLPDIQ